MSGSIYDLMGADPERANRFASAMTVFATRPEYHTSHVLEGYDWASLSQAHVIDIGGAQGHIGIELARRFPRLTVTIQDIREVIRDAKVPADLENRVRFEAHDFFSPQGIEADVYYFRWILHQYI
jgi:2-polyprenyl-3-methyl-5-hydroxy-6-metoxy-1,4-benzoquinol methylase